MPSNSFTIRLLQFLKKNKVFLVYIPTVIFWLLTSFGLVVSSHSIERFKFNDKLAHILSFFFLTLFVNMTCIVQKKIGTLKRYPFFFSFLLIALYGLLTEFIQLYVPGRSCDFLDWLADISGAFLAVIILYPVFVKAIKTESASQIMEE